MPLLTKQSTIRRSFFLAAMALLWLIAIGYHKAPENAFHFDDYENITEHAPIWLDQLTLEGLINAGQNARLSNRPLPSATFAFDWWRGAGEASTFQWTNLVIHAINSLIVLAFLNLIIQQHGIKADKRTLFCAFLGAALWSIHPIQIQGVTYIVQRMASMATLFTMLAVLSYVLGRQSAGKQRLAWMLLCLLATLGGALSKENAWIAPLLLLLAEYGIYRHGKPLIRSRIDYIWLSLPIFLGIYVVIDLASSQGPLYHYVQAGYSARDFTLSERLLTQPRVILFHLSQIIWPNPASFSIEHDFTLSKGLFDPPETILAILTIIGWAVAGIVFLLIKNYRLWGFCILWVPLTLAIESSAVGLEMVFEHRMYMPLVGLTALVSLCLAALSRHKKSRFIVTAGGVAIFNIACLMATLQRIPDWQSRTTLSESAIPHAPNSPRLLATLASAYALTGRLEESADAAQGALEQDPDNPYALEALGIVSMDKNQLEQAEDYFSRAYEGFGPKDQLLNHWGELKVKRGLYKEAHTLFSWAIKTRPWISTYHWNIAVTYERLNQCTNARMHWDKFLELSHEEGERSEVKAHLAEVHYSPTGKCATHRAP